jgi:hypothetical protein
MYITELDRPWLETSFLFQGIDVKSAADIEEVRKYCEYVYVEERQSQVAKARQKSQVQRVPIKRPGLYPTDNVRGLGRPRKSLASSLRVRLVLFSLLLILPLQASS